MSIQDNHDTAAERETARAQMLELISDRSESRWAAGWMDGIEETVRAAGGVWTVLAAACGGWPVGYRAEGGWDPLTDDEQATVRRLLEDPGGRGG